MSNTLAEIYPTLFERVLEDDEKSQRYYLSVIEEQRKIDCDYILNREGIFIPNNDYISYYLGNDSYNAYTGLYYNQICNWTLYYIFPIKDLLGDTVGIVGWDAQNKYLEQTGTETGLPMYKVSSKTIFPKDRYFFSDVDLLKDTFDLRTIIITDGVFDSMCLNYRGIPAISLLGSNISPEVLYFLRWYDRIFVAKDNDTAGTMLYKKLKRLLPNVYQLVQKSCKDIEEFMRDDGLFGQKTKLLEEIINNKNFREDFIFR